MQGRNWARPMDGTAVKLQEVPTNGLHVSVEPNNPPGAILDKHGAILTKEAGWMARLDTRASEKVEISKGTIFLIGIIPAVLMLAFNYGGSVLGWARDDQTQKEQIGIMQMQLTETRNDVKSLNGKFDEIQRSLQSQAERNARSDGYKLGQTDAGATGHK